MAIDIQPKRMPVTRTNRKASTAAIICNIVEALITMYILAEWSRIFALARSSEYTHYDIVFTLMPSSDERNAREDASRPLIRLVRQ
jgi:hypothetical protein